MGIGEGRGISEENRRMGRERIGREGFIFIVRFFIGSVRLGFYSSLVLWGVYVV